MSKVICHPDYFLIPKSALGRATNEMPNFVPQIIYKISMSHNGFTPPTVRKLINF